MHRIGNPFLDDDPGNRDFGGELVAIGPRTSGLETIANNINDPRLTGDE
jgi:hypothetical protein